MLHQLTFFIDQEVLVSLARDGAWADVDGNKCDMYNTLRNAFVITGNLNRKADIVSNIEERAQEKIAEAVQRFYGFTIDPAAEIEIVKSAGNITFFFQPSEKEESDMGENGEAANCGTTSGIVLDVLPGTERESRSGYAEKFLNAAVRKRRFTDVDTLVRALQQVHENAERIGSTAEPLHVPDVKLYLFWGRFHTIVSDDESPVVRFMPAHFQAQLLWGFLSSAELIVQQVESGILEESLEKDDANQEFINALINSIQYAHLANEDFKRSLEGDSNNVYCPIEKRWHLEQTLVHLKEFASFLSGYLERNFQKRSLVIEERQNKVLFGIGILGIVALIETWGSFLDLLNGENYAGAFDAGPLRMIFESPEALVQFNMLTPFIVAILCASALVYIFARRGR